MRFNSKQLLTTTNERTTAATDVLLALVGLGGAIYLLGAAGGGSWKASVWAWVFGLVAFSGALGALAHGFHMSSGLHTTLWQGINLGLGLAVSLFVVGVVYDLSGPAGASRILKTMLAAGIGFYLLSRLFPGSFIVFILYQAAALLFALASYGYLAVTGLMEGAVLMALGVLVTLSAAFIQTRQRWLLRIIWQFDHNGLYHLVQAAGMILILFGLAASL